MPRARDGAEQPDDQAGCMPSGSRIEAGVTRLAAPPRCSADYPDAGRTRETAAATGPSPTSRLVAATGVQTTQRSKGHAPDSARASLVVRVDDH